MGATALASQGQQQRWQRQSDLSGSLTRFGRTTGSLSGVLVAERPWAPANRTSRVCTAISCTDRWHRRAAWSRSTRAALRGARDCMAGDVQNGRLDLRDRIHVEDV